ncbi:MAG: hypothetical protein JWR72_1102 [Flavisolibacter sp.]|jgi:hypothetical protein|nr:hypothetical protein [Flavisolibacter sp.]
MYYGKLLIGRAPLLVVHIRGGHAIACPSLCSRQRAGLSAAIFLYRCGYKKDFRFYPSRKRHLIHNMTVVLFKYCCVAIYNCLICQQTRLFPNSFYKHFISPYLSFVTQ